MRAGMQIGQAILDRKLGQGGMAEVWLGHHAVLDTPLAVKFLISPWAGHPDLEQRFLNEAKRQGALDHPNIVKAYGFEYVEGHSFLIMQYIDGESLDDKMVRGGRQPLDSGEILRLATGALAGLEYAHNHHVVHRDVKPSNIMIDRSSHVYLSDFGLALVRDEQRGTRTGTMMGTPLYMSPEQILRPKEVDYRADIYSFGCVLYEMFTGRTPFEGGEDGTDFNIKMAHTGMAPPPLRQFNSAVSPEVEAVVMKCLEKNPNDRFSTCAELRDALIKAMPVAMADAVAIPVPVPAAARTPPSSDDFQKLFEEPGRAPAPVPVPVPVAVAAPVPPPPPPPRITAAPLPPPPYPPGPPQRRAFPIPVPAMIGLGALLFASLAGATYYVTKHYFAPKPNPEQQSQMRDGSQPDGSQPGGAQPDGSQPVGSQPNGSPPDGSQMPQPESKVGTLSNAPGPPVAQAVPPQQPPPQQAPEPPVGVEPQQPEAPPLPRGASVALAALPINDLKFRVKLRTKISTETSEEGQTITASVLAPASCGGCTLVGVVNKTGRTGLFVRKAELLFNFYTLKFPNGQLRAVDSRIEAFKNSKGVEDRDEEDQKVDAAHAAKKIFIAAAAGTVIGALTGRPDQGTAAGARLGVMLTGFTAKGKSMTFAPGSVFELRVSDKADQSQ